MYISYKTFCNKIFTSEGYTFVQPGSFHILGKNIKIIRDNYNKYVLLCLYENDQVFYIKIRYPEAQIWINAISVYDINDKQVIYSDFIEKKEEMIINNSEDINNLRNIIELYKLYQSNSHLDIVRYNQKIYLTTGVF